MASKSNSDVCVCGCVTHRGRKRGRRELVAGYMAMMEVAPHSGYDGRGRGVDVYECSGCGGRFYTEYGDRGVTPFSMRCRECGVGLATHTDTLPSCLVDGEVHRWVRPTLKEFLRMSPEMQDHVLNGGLVLMDDILRDNTPHGAVERFREAVLQLLREITTRYFVVKGGEE